MFSDSYKERVRRKYTKCKQNKGLFFACLYILLYILRDSLNSFLVYAISKLEDKSKIVNKEVVFLEPRQQGYGDLLFQTPLFESLTHSGYKVSVLIQKKHLPIIENNPYISCIYSWEDWREIMLRLINIRGYVIFLGRNTFSETVLGLMFFKSRRIILDKDLKLWKKLFSTNHTAAWQELIKLYLDSNLKFNTPKIYRAPASFGRTDKKKVGIIVGVDKVDKRYEKMTSLVDQIGINKNYDIYLLGSCGKKYSNLFEHYIDPPYINLLNGQSYEEVIGSISTMNAVVGTEGSLIQVSTTLGIPTIVLENRDSFWKYSGLNKTENIITLQADTPLPNILKSLNVLIKSN